MYIYIMNVTIYVRGRLGCYIYQYNRPDYSVSK